MEIRRSNSQAELSTRVAATRLSGRAHAAVQVPRLCLSQELFSNAGALRFPAKTGTIQSAHSVGRSAISRSARAIAVISDMDQTLIPAHGGQDIPAAFRGAAELLNALDRRAGKQSQNIFYVTARNADSARPLSQWLKKNGLPTEHIESGGGHNRQAAAQGKLQDICAIMNANPNRRFVLLGDSSHVDSEVYHEIARRYPDQVEAVFIHKVDEISARRLRGHTAFENYGQVATALRDRGLLEDKAWAKVVRSLNLG